MIARALCSALVACLLASPVATAGEVKVSDLGTAGTLVLDNLPACLAEDFANAYQKCLPPSPANNVVGQEKSAAHVDRAVLLIYMRRWDDARRELEHAIGADPQRVGPRHLAARVAIFVYMERHEQPWLDAARAYLSVARQLSPGNPDVLASEAYLIEATGQTDAAIKMYGEAIALKADHGFALAQRGMLLEALGWPDRALKDYDQAINAAPDNAIVRRARAGLLFAVGRGGDALADLDLLLSRNPYDFRAVMTRAAVHYSLSQHEAALEDLNTLIYGPKGGMPFAVGGEQLAGFLMQRAMVLTELKRTREATDDAIRATEIGGKRKILRLQVYLRRHGFPQLELDGVASPALTTAVEACFGRTECRDGLAAQT